MGLDSAIRARVASLDAGNYRANTEHVLREFETFLRGRGVTSLEDLTVLDCRRYAQWLRARVDDEDDPLSAASAHANGPYFTIVRAFLGWCVDDERLETNPARPNRVTSELPAYHGDADRQFWTADARDRLLSYLDERAHEALDDGDAHAAYRDRALVAVLAYTGVRGAEVFSDPRDDARNGLRWHDVDLDRGVAEVFGKTREREPVSLPDRAATALDRYRRLFDPPSESWPVFPTGHRPSLSRAAREGLAAEGWEPSRIEDHLEGETLSILRDHDIAPPALSKNGARSLMKRLCDAADVDVDGEYLKPHGGRRALGDQLYAADAELAQETLRHRSVETTHRAYRDQHAAERRERIDDVLDP